MSGVCFLYTPDLVELGQMAHPTPHPPPDVRMLRSEPLTLDYDAPPRYIGTYTVVLGLLCSWQTSDGHWEAFYMQRS